MSDLFDKLFDELGKGKSNIENEQAIKNLNIAEEALLNKAEVVIIQGILISKGICTEKDLEESRDYLLNNSSFKERLDKIRTMKVFDPDFVPPEVDEEDKKWFKENANRVLSKEDYESWLKVLEIE